MVIVKTPTVVFRRSTVFFRVYYKDSSSGLPEKEGEVLFSCCSRDCKRSGAEVAHERNREKELHLQSGVGETFCFPTEEKDETEEEFPATEYIREKMESIYVESECAYL